MKYFFLIFAAVVALVVGYFGLRGDKSGKSPIEIFPDMDRQDVVKGQAPSDFFHDGMGARLPVKGTVPHSSDDGVFPVEFGEGRTGYYYTGGIGHFYGSGLPKEKLNLVGEGAEAEMQTLLRRGEERYGIYCAICHGDSGIGNGTVSRYMAPKVANLQDPSFNSENYPEGRLYGVITHGSGLMSGYGANIPVRDRWAIVAYVRALQDATAAPAAAPTEETAPEGEPAPEGESETPEGDKNNEPAGGTNN